MRRKIVIALGGNAIKRKGQRGTGKEQFENIRISCRQIIGVLRQGYRVVITHGNGPQVGNLLIQQEQGKLQVPRQPLDICGAMTQGQIGYMLEQALKNILREERLNLDVVTVITQVLVDREDPRFLAPDKPIGPFYTKELKEKYEKEKAYVIKKVGPNDKNPYRRVVPSPEPLRIIEGEIIKKLVESGIIVIASGGGGIPVFFSDTGRIMGIEAVIDKDLSGEKLCESISADIFAILTDVEKVALNYGTRNQRDLDVLSLKDAKKYIKEGHFQPGSMKPKVEACVRFLEFGGEKAIITSIDKLQASLSGKAGTTVMS